MWFKLHRNYFLKSKNLLWLKINRFKVVIKTKIIDMYYYIIPMSFKICNDKMQGLVCFYFRMF